MSNLFSVFDPASIFNLSLNWFSMGLPMIFYPVFYFLKFSRFYWVFSKVLFFLKTDLSNSMKKIDLNCVCFFISLFLVIMFMNLLGLFPYIFTPTSHPVITLGLCLPFWFSFILESLMNNLFFFCSHVLPQGSPLILSPFMVLVESLSLLIRPITLSVRLAANMIAGHLLIVLITSVMQDSFISYFLFLFPSIALFFLEFGVSFIQAYVFMSLISLYMAEVH